MYSSKLNLMETERAIKFLKAAFEDELSKALNLTRISAPLFVPKSSGLNDNLNGVERPVSFDVKATGEEVEVVHSLAKWKRYALAKYGFSRYSGLYTDMNAIRRDEDMDALHSIYVDQWDWEVVIGRDDRTPDYLESTVNKIYGAIRTTAEKVRGEYPVLENRLPEEITFITAQQLEDMYPALSPKQRETGNRRALKVGQKARRTRARLRRLEFKRRHHSLLSAARLRVRGVVDGYPRR